MVYDLKHFALNLLRFVFVPDYRRRLKLYTSWVQATERDNHRMGYAVMHSDVSAQNIHIYRRAQVTRATALDYFFDPRTASPRSYWQDRICPKGE